MNMYKISRHNYQWNILVIDNIIYVWIKHSTKYDIIDCFRTNNQNSNTTGSIFRISKIEQYYQIYAWK